MDNSEKKLKEHSEAYLVDTKMNDEVASRCHDNKCRVLFMHFVHRLESPFAHTISQM